MSHCPSSFSSLRRSGSEKAPFSGLPEAEAVEVVLLAGALSRAHAPPRAASRRKLPTIACRVTVFSSIIYLPCKPLTKLQSETQEFRRRVTVVVGRQHAPAAPIERKRGDRGWRDLEPVEQVQRRPGAM